jgi:hypothetical protein
MLLHKLGLHSLLKESFIHGSLYMPQTYGTVERGCEQNPYPLHLGIPSPKAELYAPQGLLALAGSPS